MMVIHKLLSEGAYPNKTTIARAIEMTTKTVKRDLDFMRDRSRLPIEFDVTPLLIMCCYENNIDV